MKTSVTLYVIITSNASECNYTECLLREMASNKFFKFALFLPMASSFVLDFALCFVRQMMSVLSSSEEDFVSSTIRFCSSITLLVFHTIVADNLERAAEPWENFFKQLVSNGLRAFCLEQGTPRTNHYSDQQSLQCACSHILSEDKEQISQDQSLQKDKVVCRFLVLVAYLLLVISLHKAHT